MLQHVCLLMVLADCKLQGKTSYPTTQLGKALPSPSARQQKVRQEYMTTHSSRHSMYCITVHPLYKPIRSTLTQQSTVPAARLMTLLKCKA